MKRAYYIAQLEVAGGLLNKDASIMLKDALAEFNGYFGAIKGEIDQRISENDFYKVTRKISESMTEDDPAGDRRPN
ncbi:MAG: hypothetical protein HKP25_03650 [Marinicaulis sp.]|nr:hypothetical protein [Marinicaulis sp.]NNL88140.1 hypothetical protein [Marinicaulis sp.]